MNGSSPRVQHLHHLSFETPPNTRMSIKSSGDDEQHWCTFVGLEKGRYILIRLDKELTPLAIRGNRVTIKYILENLIFGFMTTVIGSVTKPFPLLFLEYPQAVESLDLRHQNRAICFLPVTLFWHGDEYPGHILDISSGGCRVAVDLGATLPLTDLEVGESLFCHFRTDGQEDIYAKCILRSAGGNADKLCLGLEFVELPPDTAQQIEGYVGKNNHFRISCS